MVSKGHVDEDRWLPIELETVNDAQEKSAYRNKRRDRAIGLQDLVWVGGFGQAILPEGASGF